MKSMQQMTRKSSSILAIVFLALLSVFLVARNAPFEQTTFRNLRDLASRITLGQMHVLLITNMGDRLRKKESLIWTFNEDPKRPFIYTFFEPIDKNQTDYELIAAWKHAWYQAGWNPRILSIQDAKKHPNYNRVSSAVLHAVESFGYDENEVLFFLRYFAMATIKDGGWMVDLDAFPISFHPDEYKEAPAKFTSYGQGVRSLIGGTQQEWERIANFLLREGVEYHRKNMKSFPEPFSELTKSGDINTKIETGNFETLQMGALNSGKTLDCEWLKKNVRVIHGSHKEITDANFDTSNHVVALGDTMQRFHEDCNGPDFYTSAKRQILAELSIRGARQVATSLSADTYNSSVAKDNLSAAVTSPAPAMSDLSLPANTTNPDAKIIPNKSIKHVTAIPVNTYDAEVVQRTE